MDEFRLKLTGDGISAEKTIDRGTALAVLNIVLGSSDDAAKATVPTALPAAVTPTEGIPSAQLPPPVQHSPSSRPISLREFVNDHEPKTNAQIILCIAQYLVEQQGMDRFGREVVRPKFAAAGEPLPKNFTRDFQTAIDKGWIGEDPQNRDQFYVTRTGENQLASGFGSKRN